MVNPPSPAFVNMESESNSSDDELNLQNVEVIELNDEEEDILAVLDPDIDDNEEDDDDEDNDDDDDDPRDGSPHPEFIQPDRDDSLITLSEHKKPVFCSKFHPFSGEIAVSGGQDDIAYLWNVQTGNILKVFNHEDSVVAVDFSMDGKLLVTADMSGYLQVYKLSNKTSPWQTNIVDLTWAQWHLGAYILFAGCYGGEIYMWKIPTGECKVMHGEGNKCESFAIMPDGRRGVAGYENGSVKIIEFKTMSALYTISPHTSTVTAIDTHSDNNMAVTASLDKTIAVIKTQDGKITSLLNTSSIIYESISSQSTVDTLKFYKDSTMHLIAAGTLDGFLVIWDFAHMIARQVFHQPSGIIRLIWRSQEPKVYTAGIDGIVRLFDVVQGVKVKEWHGHWSHVLDLDLSRDGQKLLTASEDKTLKVFNALTN